jgi:DNA gyrase subunit B
MPEVYRVLKPGGRVVVCHLTAHGEGDRERAFYIQRLRNPARKNFFMPEDFSGLLERNGFKGVELVEYLSRESVNQWIDHGAITGEDMERIREAYRTSDDAFKRIHSVEFKDNDILDTMKLVIARGRKG